MRDSIIDDAIYLRATFRLPPRPVGTAARPSADPGRPQLRTGAARLLRTGWSATIGFWRAQLTGRGFAVPAERGHPSMPQIRPDDPLRPAQAGGFFLR